MAKVNEILKVMGIFDGENYERARQETLESEEFLYGRRDLTAFKRGSDVERRWILLYNLVLANRIAYCLLSIQRIRSGVDQCLSKHRPQYYRKVSAISYIDLPSHFVNLTVCFRASARRIC